MNKVLLVGRISNDIRMYRTNSGISYARTSVAVNRRSSNDKITDFIPIVAWRNSAEFLNNYASKGALVSIEGSFTSSQYEGQNGTVWSYEVTVDNISLLEPRSVREQRTGKSGEYSATAPSFNQANYQQPKNQNTTKKAASSQAQNNSKQNENQFGGFLLDGEDENEDSYHTFSIDVDEN